MTKRDRGQRAYLSGLSAEEAVMRQASHAGLSLVARRWRGQGGEIDLIFKEGSLYVFVEVKKARTFDAALNSLKHSQMRRIHAAASEYLAYTPNGQLSDVRFDLALVDEQGRVEFRQDAFSHF